MQLITEKQCQLLDLGRRDHRLGHSQAAGEIGNLLGEFVPAEPQINQPLTHRSVLGIHQALLDQFQQPGDASFRLLVIMAHLPQSIAVAIFAFDRRAQIVAEQTHQVLGLQYLLRHLADHDAIELVHRHAQPLAAERPLFEAARTAVVSIGVTIHAHLMRHLAAHLYLLANPGDYETVRRLLGHKNIETTIRFYEGLLTDDAFARYDGLIEEMRSKTAAKPSKPSGSNIEDDFDEGDLL